METIFKPSFKDYCKSFYKENYKKLLRPLEVHKDIVNAVSVNEFESYQYLKNINGQNQFYFFNADNEHYKFLKYLTFYYNHITIIDAGTRFGESAFCLGLNRNNKIISYDINPVNPEYSKDFDNIQFKTMDINNETDTIIHSAFIIFLDIDPHDGNQEKIFYDRLLEINWSGYLICDDVQYSIPMREFWNQVSLPKLLLQECGHWTGTGVIRFGEYITV